MSEIICKKVVCKKDLCKEGNLQIDRRKQENISQLIAQVLADVRALKKSAVDYAHPEVRVTSSDPTLLQWLFSNMCTIYILMCNYQNIYSTCSSTQR